MDLLSTSRLFQEFLAQRRYLKNVTTSTIEWYETAFKSLQCIHGADPVISRPSLQSFVVTLRQRGVKPISCNTYIKALNAFCRWLHEESEQAAEEKITQMLWPCASEPGDHLRVASKIWSCLVRLNLSIA
jgi:site-specific recombinase XerD